MIILLTHPLATFWFKALRLLNSAMIGPSMAGPPVLYRAYADVLCLVPKSLENICFKYQVDVELSWWMWMTCDWHMIHDVVCHQLVAAVFPGLCKPNPQELVSGFKIRWLEWCWNVHAYLSHTSWKTSPILTIPDMFFKPFHTIHRAFETLWRRNPTTQIWKLHVSAHVKSQCESTAMLRVFFLSTMTFGRKASLPHEIVPTSLDFHVSPGWLPSIWIQLFGLQWWPLADSTPLKEPVG